MFDWINQVPELEEGAHLPGSRKLCAMEAVAWLAGEKHSDQPECACPIIGVFVRCTNDYASNRMRQELAAFLPRILDSRDSFEVMERRFTVLEVGMFQELNSSDLLVYRGTKFENNFCGEPLKGELLLQEKAYFLSREFPGRRNSGIVPTEKHIRRRFEILDEMLSIGSQERNPIPQPHIDSLLELA